MTLLRAVMAASLALLAGCSPARENAAVGASDASDSAASDGSTTDGATADADCSVETSFEMAFQTHAFGELLAGARVRTVPCGDELTTDSAGSVRLPVAADLPFSIEVRDPSIVPQVVGEWSLSRFATFRDSFLTTLDGDSLGFTLDEARLVPRYFSVGASQARDGIRVSVKDHPEAIVTYSDWNFSPRAGATETDVSGHFVISGLADGFVEVLASKPGFNVLASPKDDSIQLTGRVPVRTGFVSHVMIVNLGAGDGG